MSANARHGSFRAGPDRRADLSGAFLYYYFGPTPSEILELDPRASAADRKIETIVADRRFLIPENYTRYPTQRSGGRLTHHRHARPSAGHDALWARPCRRVSSTAAGSRRRCKFALAGTQTQPARAAPEGNLLEASGRSRAGRRRSGFATLHLPQRQRLCQSGSAGCPRRSGAHGAAALRPPEPAGRQPELHTLAASRTAPRPDLSLQAQSPVRLARDRSRGDDARRRIQNPANRSTNCRVRFSTDPQSGRSMSRIAMLKA